MISTRYSMTGLAILLVGAGAAGSAETNTVKAYTLDACLRIGLERSVTALNAGRDQAIARATVTQARSQALPQLTAAGSYRRLDELQTIDLGGESMSMGTLDNYSVDLKASQLLFSGGKVGAAIEAAKLARGYADWKRADVETALVRDIRTGFYDLLLAKAMVKVKEESVQQIERLVDQTDQKFKNGRASEFDLLSARVRLANERPELIRARNVLAVALEGYKRLINVDDAGFDVEGTLEVPAVEASLEALCQQALLNRPALKEMEAGVALREQDMAAAKSGYYPTLSAYYLYNGANSYGFVSYEDDWQWHWSVGVVASWSLWDSGLTYGAVKEKRLELAKARATLDDTRKGITLEIKQATLDLQRARETIEAGRGNVQMAEKALAISQSRLDSGLATYLEFTDANQALREAQLSLSLALRDSMAAAARLRYAAAITDTANTQAGGTR